MIDRPLRAWLSSLLLLLAAAVALPAPLWANEDSILYDLKSFLTVSNPLLRERLAARIEADPSYRRDRVGEWLHRLDLYPPRPKGLSELQVPVGLGQVRTVALRLPKGYSARRAWPVIYALHPSGGNGPFFIDYVEQLLGARVEDFILVAPSDYHQTSLDAPPPFTADHLAILRAVRRAVHVDSDRVYALGYSLGGYAAWAVACLHADQLAGAVPISSAFSIPPTADGLWRSMLPNFSHLPILNVWGADDTLEVLGVLGPESLGGIALLNRRLVQWTREMTLPQWTNVEIPGRGHGGATPPAGPLAVLLAGRRERYPLRVEHNFRHLFQGHSYWLEAAAWEGPSWGAEVPNSTPRTGESTEQAFGRAAGELLGHLRGEVVGQTFKIDRRHVSELIVWVGDGMIDWEKPVTVELAGRRLYKGNLRPDLLVCLNEAARTFDFDRLRWAGLRVEARTAKAVMVTGRTVFSPLFQ